MQGNQVCTDQRDPQVVSAIHAFFLAMVLYPEVQAKAKAELDAVVGSERLPCFNDRDSLSYINAVWKEVLRWHSIAPLGTTCAPVDVFTVLTKLGQQVHPMLQVKTFITKGSLFQKDRTLSEMHGEYCAGLRSSLNI